MTVDPSVQLLIASRGGVAGKKLMARVRSLEQENKELEAQVGRASSVVQNVLSPAATGAAPTGAAGPPQDENQSLKARKCSQGGFAQRCARVGFSRRVRHAHRLLVSAELYAYVVQMDDTVEYMVREVARLSSALERHQSGTRALAAAAESGRRGPRDNPCVGGIDRHRDVWARHGHRARFRLKSRADRDIASGAQ